MRKSKPARKARSVKDAERTKSARSLCVLRDRAKGMNLALLTCRAFANPEPIDQQTWHVASAMPELRRSMSPEIRHYVRPQDIRSRSSHCFVTLGSHVVAGACAGGSAPRRSAAILLDHRKIDSFDSFHELIAHIAELLDCHGLAPGHI